MDARSASEYSSPQSIFDTVARHLFTQGKPAMNANGDCLYRAPDGSKCAVGCLLQDDDYKPHFERVHVTNLPGLGYRPQWLTDNVHLLSDLQSVHDHGNWETTDGLKSDLREIAEYRRLSPAILDTLSFSDR